MKNKLKSTTCVSPTSTNKHLSAVHINYIYYYYILSFSGPSFQYQYTITGDAQVLMKDLDNPWKVDARGEIFAVESTTNLTTLNVLHGEMKRCIPSSPALMSLTAATPKNPESAPSPKIIRASIMSVIALQFVYSLTLLNKISFGLRQQPLVPLLKNCNN